MFVRPRVTVEVQVAVDCVFHPGCVGGAQVWTAQSVATLATGCREGLSELSGFERLVVGPRPISLSLKSFDLTVFLCFLLVLLWIDKIVSCENLNCP